MIYKINITTKIFMILLGLFFLYGGIWVYSSAIEYRLFYRILYLVVAFSVSFAAFWAIIFYFHSFRILIDNSKIELFYFDVFYKKLQCVQKKMTPQSLKWEEIKEVRANFILFPESPIIILIPFEGLNKKRIEFPLQGLPLDLVRQILKHLNPNTKLNLYPYLEKLLQRKPDSKRKVISIAAIIVFTIAAGFLLAWFQADNIAIILSLIVLVGLLFATSILIK